MFPEDPFPPTTSAWVLFLIFAALTLVFHLVLVFWLKLTKRAWKIVDYVWLGIAALGLGAAAASNRQTIALSRLPLSEARVDTAYEPMKFLVDSYSSKNGPVCKGPFSDSPTPSLKAADPVTRDYGAVCQWFGQVASKLPAIGKRELIGDDILPLDPTLSTTDPKVDPKLIIVEFRKQVGWYNDRVKVHEELKRKVATTEWEERLAFASPLLLAFALSLRVTKVSGELRAGSIAGEWKKYNSRS